MKSSLHIVALFNRVNESDRRMTAGALRVFAQKGDIELRLLNPMARDFKPTVRRLANAWRVDGVLTATDGCESVRRGNFSHSGGNRPVCVVIDPDVRDIAPWATGSVSINDTLVARSAADLLTSRHLDVFAYVGTVLPLDTDHLIVRARSFAQEITARRHVCKVFSPSDKTPSGWIAELPHLATWLAALPKPCAIMAYSDERAGQVVEACHLADITIPDQLAIIGVDNDAALCESLSPALSSVEPDFHGAGAAGAKMLTALLETHRTPRKPLRKTYGVRRVVERGSTIDLRGGGRLVSTACDYLRQHFAERISLRQLAHILRISPRLLELHAKKILGHSLREETQRIRLENVQRLLRETTTPLAEIAENSGFGSATALMLAFKRRFGLTAGTYRTIGDRFQDAGTASARAQSAKRSSSFTSDWTRPA